MRVYELVFEVDLILSDHFSSSLLLRVVKMMVMIMMVVRVEMAKEKMRQIMKMMKMIVWIVLLEDYVHSSSNIVDDDCDTQHF
jgi:hypothetical protein